MAGGAGAIKAGKAFVELFTESSQLFRGLDAAAARCKQWGTQIRNFGAQLGAGGGALLGPLLASLREATQRGNLFGMLSANTGQTVESLADLADMAERAGVSVEQYAGAVQALEVRAREAADANDFLFENMKSLGTGAAFARLTATEKMEQLAEAVRRTVDPVQQLRIATQAYGDVGESLLPILRGGADAVRQFRGEGSLSSEQTRAAVERTRAWNEILTDLRKTVREVGFAIMPSVENIRQMRDTITSVLARVRDWIKQNRALIVTVGATAVGIVAAGTALVGLGAAAAAVGAVGAAAVAVLVKIGAVVGLAVAAAKAAVAALFSPVGAAVAVGAALTALWVTQTESGQRFGARVRETFRGFAEYARVRFRSVLTDARQTWQGVSDALKAGDFGLAIEVGIAGIKLLWTRLTVFVREAWADSLAAIEHRFAPVIEAARFAGDVIAEAWTDIKLRFQQTATWLNDAFVVPFEDALGKVWGWLKDMAAKAGNAMKAVALAITAPLLALAAALDEALNLGIKQKLEEQLAGIKDAIDKEVNGIGNLISGNAAERRARIVQDQAARSRQLLNELNEARLNAEAAQIQAAQAAARAGTAPPGAAPGAGGAAPGPPNLRARLADAVKSITGGGGGASTIGRQLAFGDTVPQQQLDAQRSIQANTDQMPQMARDVNALLQSGRVGR